ncbi:hypothetical protein ACFSJU_12335 [Paradesertivirga mongoliensis]|uniref:Uncharacterized protein n=1 Tax=Paradesertivirga mongoliensis TaxID=2100740 RepID=A0ABW4ZM76_9SPHI|nr:hypothetical protein [Pedobacter mongoliensis]
MFWYNIIPEKWFEEIMAAEERSTALCSIAVSARLAEGSLPATKHS